MNKQPTYPADHPVAIALAGMALAARLGCGLLDALAQQAERVGVRPYSDHFDDAARLAGLPYFPHGVIAEMVNAQVEGAQASAKSVRWYAHDMRKKGIEVPERQRVAESDPV